MGCRMMQGNTINTLLGRGAADIADTVLALSAGKASQEALQSPAYKIHSFPCTLT